jgi:hypothetical protein
VQRGATKLRHSGGKDSPAPRFSLSSTEYDESGRKTTPYANDLRPDCACLGGAGDALPQRQKALLVNGRTAIQLTVGEQPSRET